MTLRFRFARTFIHSLIWKLTWWPTMDVRNLSNLSKKEKLIYFLIALTKTAKPVTGRSVAAFL